MKKRMITEKLIEEFKNNLRMEEKSLATISKYIHDVNVFSEYTNGQCITKDIVIQYKEYLLKNYAIRSVNSMLASINCLFAFLGWNDCSVKSIKIQRQIFRSAEKELTKQEYFRLVQAAKSKGNKRLYLLLQTICGTGIRVSELKFITVEAVKSGQAIVSNKGKTRSVFIVRNLQNKLMHYIKEIGITTGIVFRTSKGNPISRSNIWKDMKNLCTQANVNPNKVFPHNLRHLFARTFYSIEKDIAKLAS